MSVFIAFNKAATCHAAFLGSKLAAWRNHIWALRTGVLVMMFAAFPASAQTGLVPGVPNPHARPLNVPSHRAVNTPDEKSGPLGACVGLDVVWVTGESGDFGYSVTIQASVIDLDGDGVIRADAGFYALYDGPNEVMDLTVSFYQSGVLLETYANVTSGSVNYPFLYLEWAIGSLGLKAFDLGEDPGIYCFGGPGITGAPGLYFSDSTNARGGELGAFGSDSCVIADTQLAYTGSAFSTIFVGLDVNGSHAFLARDLVLEVYDVSDLESPSLVGTSDPAPGGISFRGRVVAGSAVAVVALQAGLNFYDIRDPTDPVRFGFSPIDGFHLEREGDTVFALGVSGGLAAYDAGVITTSLLSYNPSVINPRDMVVDGGICYVAVGGLTPAVQFVDVSDPMDMNIIGQISDAEQPQVVGSANGLLCYWALSADTLNVIDVRDPANPVRVGALSIAPATFTGDIAMRGSYAYVGVGEEILQIDLSDPSNPAVSRQYAGTSRRHKVDNGVLHSLGSEWRAYELASQLGSESVPGEAASVSLDDEHDVAYVANGSAGLSVLDVRSPGNPWRQGSTSAFEAIDVVHKDRFAFVAGGSGGLRVVDASDPDSPILATTMPFTDAVGRLEIEGDIVLAAAGSAGLRLVDVGVPSAPVERGVLDVFDARGVAVQDGLACVVGDDAGGTLWVVDVSDADAPVVLASMPTAFVPKDVALLDEFACVVGSGGLEVVDISSPASPIPLGRATLPEGQNRVSIAYGLAIATSSSVGVTVLDVATDPCVPVSLGSWQSSGNAGGAAVQGGVGLVAAGSGGAEILDLSRCFERGADTDANGTPDYRELVQNRTQGTGFGTLQAALNGAADGDLIEIASGVLEEDGVVFPVGIDVLVRGASARRTIIDGGGGSDQSPILSFESTFQTPATVISDLTLRNGVNTFVTGGGAVRSSGSAPRFERVRFIDNRGPDSLNGAAHIVAANSSSLEFEHCEFRGGYDAYDAIGASSGSLIMVGCLVAENATAEAVVHSGTGTIEMTNCTVLGDDTSLGVALASFTGELNVRNSIVLGTTPSFGSGSIVLAHCLTPGAVGSGNIDGVPSFVNRAAGDHRLASGSLGIDAGSNPLASPNVSATDLGDDPRFTDDPGTPDTGVGPAPVIDMGAYEFQPPVVPRCPADLTGVADAPDGVLNLDDVSAFVEAFLDGERAADLNHDGQINLDDLGLFVDWFLAGCP